VSNDNFNIIAWLNANANGVANSNANSALHGGPVYQMYYGWFGGPCPDPVNGTVYTEEQIKQMV